MTVGTLLQFSYFFGDTKRLEEVRVDTNSLIEKQAKYISEIVSKR